MNYLKNCAFLDKTRFDINMPHGRAWSSRGKPTIVETSSTKAISRTVLGAVPCFGSVNVAMREPGNVKRRKVMGATKRKTQADKLSIPKGTTGSNYLQSISDTIYIMENFPEMKRFCIIMDNAPIHVPSVVDLLILK